jgi:hypothetical protein
MPEDVYTTAKLKDVPTWARERSKTEWRSGEMPDTAVFAELWFERYSRGACWAQIKRHWDDLVFYARLFVTGDGVSIHGGRAFHGSYDPVGYLNGFTSEPTLEDIYGAEEAAEMRQREAKGLPEDEINSTIPDEEIPF